METKAVTMPKAEYFIEAGKQELTSTIILDAPRGANGFGYDPLFCFPQIQKTFAELTAEEKAKYSHRGAAFREFLDWCDRSAFS